MSAVLVPCSLTADLAPPASQPPRLEGAREWSTWKLEKYVGDLDSPVAELGEEEGRAQFFAGREPVETVEGIGNLVTGSGVLDLMNGLCTAALSTPYTTTNAQLAVGDSTTAAQPVDADLGAALGSSLGGGITAATNATPIVLTTSTAHSLSVGQVAVVAGVVGNTAANGTFEVSAVTSTTITLLNSAGNGAYTSGGTVKQVNKYRQAITGVTVGPTMGTSISGATNATPIVVTTSSAHGLSDGMIVKISGVSGNTAANTTAYVKVTGFSTTTFGLYTDKALTAGVAGNGAYTSGGTVTLCGYTMVATFGNNNANFQWNEWGISTGAAATNKQAAPPPTLLNHAIPAVNLGTKTNAGPWTLTVTVVIA